jgi:hypothetical protein
MIICDHALGLPLLRRRAAQCLRWALETPRRPTTTTKLRQDCETCTTTTRRNYDTKNTRTATYLDNVRSSRFSRTSRPRVGWPGDPPSRMWLFVVWCWMPCNLHDMCLFPFSTWRSIRRPISRLISPQSRSFSHSHTGVLKGLSCGSLWGLSLSCRVYSVDASSHRFRPK